MTLSFKKEILLTTFLNSSLPLPPLIKKQNKKKNPKNENKKQTSDVHLPHITFTDMDKKLQLRVYSV